MKLNKIVIGCDHAGYQMKELIKAKLTEQGYTIDDKGTHAEDSVDYPDFVHPVCREVENEEHTLGILLCGSANGVAMTANKYQGIRAAICWQDDIARLARSHNNANIICLPSRFVEDDLALTMVNTFFTTSFEGGRHERRVNKIPVNC